MTHVATEPPFSVVPAVASPPAHARVRAWRGSFEGHEIQVLTRGLFRARLYIDGECRDRRSPLFCTDRTVPLLSARLPSSRLGVTIVYVYSRAWCARRIEVRVGGKPIAMKQEASRPPGV